MGAAKEFVELVEQIGLNGDAGCEQGVEATNSHQSGSGEVGNERNEGMSWHH